MVDKTQNILNNIGNVSNLKYTFICLIPKNNNPYTPAEFFHISLCNVTIMIITKTIDNMLKPILNIIINLSHISFIFGRLIIDNDIFAHEAFHYLHKKNNTKKGYVGMKLYMAKAYDKL